MSASARGCLLGLGIGDAMGAPVENLSQQEIRQHYGEITGFLTDDVRGTDDTEYAVLHAQLLLRYGDSLSPDHIAHTYCDQLLHLTALRGAGFSELGTIENLRRGWAPPLSGAHAHPWSDGLAMRAAIYGIWGAHSLARTLRAVEIDGSVCAQSEGIWAGTAIAVAVFAALQGKSAADLIDLALAHIPETSWTSQAIHAALAAPSDEAALLAVVNPRYHWTDLAPEAVSLALRVVQECDRDPARAIPRAVSLGRDADTIAAMAGAICGAARGEDAIPAIWRQQLGPVTGRCLGDAVAGVHLDQLATELIAAAPTEEPR